MAIKDYYKILGIESTASAETIRKAYLALSKRYHPDLNQNDEESLNKFLDIAEAYKVLGNLDNRLQYTIQLNKTLKLPENLVELVEKRRKRSNRFSDENS